MPPQDRCLGQGRGDGGKVILWSDVKTTFAGTILALGGKEFGNGGFIETSSKGTADISGTISAGRGGAWLLDPTDILINAGLAATINASLNSGTDVTQQTATTGGGNGDIIVSSQISWNTSSTLTLIAFRNIRINDAGPLAGTIVNTGAGKLVMHADSTGIGVGTIDMPAGTTSALIGRHRDVLQSIVLCVAYELTVGNGHSAPCQAS